MYKTLIFMKNMKGSTRGAKFWRIFLTVLLCAVILPFLALETYRFMNCFQYWKRNKEVSQDYIREVETLRQEQQKLKNEIYKLKYNTLTKERLARELGYVKPGETVYRIED